MPRIERRLTAASDLESTSLARPIWRPPRPHLPRLDARPRESPPFSTQASPTTNRTQTLRALTASEPQTLPAERAHQRAWREDPAKLTFIVCAAAAEDAGEAPRAIRRGAHDAPARMLGDVNLFLSRAPSSPDGGGGGGGRPVAGEVNVMVAAPAERGRGVGAAVLRALMWYVAREGPELLREWLPGDGGRTGVGRLVAKIDAGNAQSVGLFRRAGFRMVSEKPNYFGEVEMEWVVEEMAGGVGGPRILEYVGGDEEL